MGCPREEPREATQKVPHIEVPALRLVTLASNVYTQMVCGLVVDRKMARYSSGKLPPPCFSVFPSVWETQHRLLWMSRSGHQKPGQQEKRLWLKMLRYAGSWTELPELQEIETSQEDWGRVSTPPLKPQEAQLLPDRTIIFWPTTWSFVFILSFFDIGSMWYRLA